MTYYAANGVVSTDPIEGGVEITEAQYAYALQGIIEGKVVSIDDGFVVIDPPAPEPFEPDPLPPTLADYQFAVQATVDETARGKQFNDGVTLASYVYSTVEAWAVQAQTFVAWRDNVWQYCYSELAKVQAGEREQPTVGEFLLELPEIVWP